MCYVFVSNVLWLWMSQLSSDSTFCASYADLLIYFVSDCRSEHGLSEDKGCECEGEGGRTAMSSERLRQLAAEGDAEQVKALLDSGAKVEPDLVSVINT